VSARDKIGDPRAASNPLPPRIAARIRESWWFALLALALYLLLVLYTYDKNDPGWSHSLAAANVHNAGGVVGAYIADLMLYLFGISAYWWVVLCAAAVTWGFRRIESVPETDRRSYAVALAGFAMVLVASSGVEALRLYSLKVILPHAPGGIIGALAGDGLASLLGFTGVAPTFPSLYNNFKRIVQTETHVMILMEMVHDARVVRLDSQHLPAGQQPEENPQWDVGVEDVLVVPSVEPLDMAEPELDPNVNLMYDRVPKGEVELRVTSSVYSKDEHRLGSVKGVAVGEDGVITMLALQRGHLWWRREVSVPVDAIASLENDVVTLAVDKNELKRSSSQRGSS